MTTEDAVDAVLFIIFLPVVITEVVIRKAIKLIRRTR